MPDPPTLNIYCDESCHLENDHQTVMVLGAIWTLKDNVSDLTKASRLLKSQHGLKPQFELKWGKVSAGKLGYYQDVLSWFWKTPELHFRGLIVPDKAKLNHVHYNQTHDEWYYKMYFDLLKVIVSPSQRHNVYLDIKDTRGRKKVQKLHEVLSNSHYDFSRSVIQKIQLVRSDEVELVQLADFMIGIVSYANRRLEANKAKHTLV